MVNVAALVTVDKDDLVELIGQVPDYLMQDVNRGLRQVLGVWQRHWERQDRAVRQSDQCVFDHHSERAVSWSAWGSAHDALRAFAKIEEPLEIIEEPVVRFMEDLERIEQQRIDEMRGK